jgi:predicted metalloprotease
VKWTRGTQNDDVVDVRGRSGGGTAMRLGGGGIGAVLIVYVVARVFGVDISGLVGGGGGGAGGGAQTAPGGAPTQPAPPSGPDPEAEQVDFIRFVMKDIQDTFTGLFQQAGAPYRRAKLLVFRDVIDTRCGRSSSAIGPFYCPADQQAYIDLSFFRDLKQRFKAPGPFAQAYVLAHEIGHHVQNLEGVEKKVRKFGRGEGESSGSVRQELQADCYAGVWGHSAQARTLLEIGDVDAALAAATAIGDDRLQKQSGREVNPETFTHGTSEQRVRWFRRGFETGRLEACDTFSVQEL